MTTGSFLTSQLPITTNAVPTDRVLVLWNAISNASVGSGSPSTRTITVNDFVNSALTTILTSIANNGTIAVGNSTVNTQINSTSIYVQTSGGTTFALNTAGVIVGNGKGLSTVPSFGSNQQIQFSNSGVLAGANGLTWDLTPQTLTVGNGSINVVINSTSITVGNSYIDPTTIKAGNACTIYVGNASHNTVIGVQSIVLTNTGTTEFSVNSTGMVVANSFIGATANVTNTYAAYVVANGALIVGNATVNVAVNSSSICYSGIVSRPSASVLLTANNALAANSNSTPQAVFPTGQKTVTLDAATTYIVDGVYMVSNSCINVNTNIQTSFGNSAALGHIGYGARGLFSNNNDANVNFRTGGAFVTTNAATNIITGVQAVLGTFVLYLAGTLSTVTAVDVTPQISWNVATNATPQILTGSFIRFTPVANSVQNTVGTWA